MLTFCVTGIRYVAIFLFTHHMAATATPLPPTPVIVKVRFSLYMYWYGIDVNIEIRQLGGGEKYEMGKM
jgi:hypothetical protein